MHNWKANWELKVLAMAMALLVWIFVKLRVVEGPPPERDPSRGGRPPAASATGQLPGAASTQEPRP